MAILNGRRQLLLWIAAALAATAALVTVLVWESRPAAASRGAFIVGVPEEGAALFFGAKQCSTCHSVNGSGGRLAPDLSATRPTAPAMGWLTTVLWNHAPGMYRQMRHGNTAYPRLNSQEMAHILAFLYQAGHSDRSGDAEAGRLVFTEKGCDRCHSVRGAGGKLAPELSAVAADGGSIAWTRAMWNHAQSMIEPVSKVLGKWPQLSGVELNNLIAYAGAPAAAESKRRSHATAERGWRVFQAKCIGCHAVRGQGGRLGPELGPEHDLPLGGTEFASVLWNHAPRMLRQVREKGMDTPTLQGNEMLDLQAFLASLRYFEPNGSPFVGERVFAARGCARCHGASAAGTRFGPALHPGPEAFTTVSFATALWKHGPHMVDTAEQLGIQWPLLQPTDIGDLVSFLNTAGRQ